MFFFDRRFCQVGNKVVWNWDVSPIIPITLQRARVIFSLLWWWKLLWQLPMKKSLTKVKNICPSIGFSFSYRVCAFTKTTNDYLPCLNYREYFHEFKLLNDIFMGHRAIDASITHNAQSIFSSCSFWTLRCLCDTCAWFSQYFDASSCKYTQLNCTSQKL